MKKIIKNNPEAVVAVIGCYAQLKSKEIKNIPGVDIVLGASEKFNLATLPFGVPPKRSLFIVEPLAKITSSK